MVSASDVPPTDNPPSVPWPFDAHKTSKHIWKVWVFPSQSVIEAAPGAADIVLSHLSVCSVYLHNYLVWFSYQIGQKETAMTVRTAEKIIGAPVPTLQDLCISKRAGGITSDHTHRPLPLWTVATKNWALEHPSTSFFFSPQAIYLMNN